MCEIVTKKIAINIQYPLGGFGFRNYRLVLSGCEVSMSEETPTQPFSKKLRVEMRIGRVRREKKRVGYIFYADVAAARQICRICSDFLNQSKRDPVPNDDLIGDHDDHDMT